MTAGDANDGAFFLFSGGTYNSGHLPLAFRARGTATMTSFVSYKHGARRSSEAAATTSSSTYGRAHGIVVRASPSQAVMSWRCAVIDYE